jgi:hypothetical protein
MLSSRRYLAAHVNANLQHAFAAVFCHASTNWSAEGPLSLLLLTRDGSCAVGIALCR